MKSLSVILAACGVLVVCLAAPAPVPAPEPRAQPDPANDNRPEIIEIIAPAASAQETLATLNLGAPGSELSERNKRTIGILRQLFPTLTQIIEQKIQQITSMVLTTFGPIVLKAFLGNRGGGGGGGEAGTGGGTVELDDDDSDDDEAIEETQPASSTAAPEPARRRRALPWGAVGDESQLLSGAESQQAEVRVAFGGTPAAGAAASDQAADQQTAAQTNSASIDEITLDDADDTEENRNKRFLNFGIGGGASAGGSGGGSGNFLFDIVRQAPANMARAAGAAWRLLSGTDALQLGVTATHTATRDVADPQLVAGSSSGSGGADAAAAADGDDVTAAKGDNLTEGVPGPITRLFIIANRGIANLIQDLILRLAQTSERIVNFKARLITSII